MKHALFLTLLLPLALHAQVAAPLAPLVDNCEPIRQQIEARFRAGGVQPTLVVVDAVGAGSAPVGRVVGTCGGGRRHIVRLGQTPLPAVAVAAPAVERAPERPVERPVERAPQREPEDKIPTECKDGSIVIGPRCDDPRAVRMTSAELAASLAPPKAASAEAPASAAAADQPASAGSR
jgi:hypothetical protein